MGRAASMPERNHIPVKPTNIITKVIGIPRKSRITNKQHPRIPIVTGLKIPSLQP
jgi:hypothetical protein